MRLALIKYNDVVDCESGICVSLWTQGCHFHCLNCHNPDQQDFNGGIEEPIDEVSAKIIQGIKKFNIHRDFSVLGGEPLCAENIENVCKIINDVKISCPDSKIYVWTGYTLEQLYKRNSEIVNNILNNIDVLIDGQYIDSLKDLTLPLRGSANQRILYKGKDF